MKQFKIIIGVTFEHPEGGTAYVEMTHYHEDYKGIPNIDEAFRKSIDINAFGSFMQMITKNPNGIWMIGDEVQAKFLLPDGDYTIEHDIEFQAFLQLVKKMELVRCEVCEC